MEEPNLQSNPNPSVGFPQTPQKAKSKTGLLIFIILGIVLLIGAGIFFIARSGNQAVASPSPTSFFQVSSPTPVATAVASPSPVASASPSAADKKKLTVEVLNGTGVPGEAAYLQGQLKNLGYEDIKTANASTQDETVTTITFAKSVSDNIQDELEAKLKTLYTEVKVSTSSTLSGIDIRILTGPRKGVSPKPSAAASSSPTSSATPKPSTSPSPSSSPQ